MVDATHVLSAVRRDGEEFPCEVSLKEEVSEAGRTLFFLARLKK